MTPKMKEDLCGQILTASRQLFLSGRISEVCREKGTQKQLEFIPCRNNLVLYGPVGVGKTHMAIVAGVKACNAGYKTKFYTVTELVLKLAEARKNTTLEKLLRDLLLSGKLYRL